jgi:phosphoribosyl-AMP cyclohydrolase
VDLRLDCDRDAILLKVEQVGGIACHTGRESCFYLGLEAGGWQEMESVAKDPGVIYGGRDD